MKIGDRIDQLDELRERMRALNAELKEIKEEFDAKEWELMRVMEELGLDQAKSDRVTVSLKKDTVGTVEDWDALEDYIKENDAFYLFQRRISSVAYKELLQMGEDVPGVKQTELTKLSMLSSK